MNLKAGQKEVKIHYQASVYCVINEGAGGPDLVDHGTYLYDVF